MISHYLLAFPLSVFLNIVSIFSFLSSLFLSLVNALNSFSAVSVSGGMLVVDGAGSVNVGTDNAASSMILNVYGSSRVRKGLTTSSEAGYSFASDPDTGMFAVGGSSTGESSLVLAVDGASRITIPSSSTSAVSVVGPYSVSGDLFVTGKVCSPRRNLFFLIAMWNPCTTFFHVSQTSLGSSSLPSSTLDVAGGVRTSVGIPVSATSNLGYSFLGDGHSGLFAGKYVVMFSLPFWNSSWSD